VSSFQDITMKIPRSRPLARGQRGYSLIEVMIAVLVMAIGLLGIAAMQTAALRNSQSSLERSQAVISAYTVLDAMRANRDAALAGDYNTGGFQCDTDGSGSLASVDRGEWVKAWRTALGVQDTDDAAACGSIDCTNGICEIGLRWDDSRASNAGDGQVAQGRSDETFKTKVQL
jgi:type IV pilus assembly protein PilV